MALIDEEEKIRRKVVKQDCRRLPGLPAVQMARVILYACTVTHLLHHLQIEGGSLPDPLFFEQLLLGEQRIRPLPEFLLYITDGTFQPFPAGNIVAVRVDGNLVQFS